MANINIESLLYGWEVKQEAWCIRRFVNDTTYYLIDFGVFYTADAYDESEFGLEFDNMWSTNIWSIRTDDALQYSTRSRVEQVLQGNFHPSVDIVRIS